MANINIIEILNFLNGNNDNLNLSPVSELNDFIVNEINHTFNINIAVHSNNFFSVPYDNKQNIHFYLSDSHRKWIVTTFI